MKKKYISKKVPTSVHAFRCTDEEYSILQSKARECGLSLSRYMVETGLKHHPRKRLTREEVDALNSLTFARADLINVRNVLSAKSDGEKLQLFGNRKFMTWWIKAVARLIEHWHSIEENITKSVSSRRKEEES